MLSASILRRFPPELARRMMRASAAAAGGAFARDCSVILARAERFGASDEHVRLALGVALAFAERQGELDLGQESATDG